MRGHSTVEASQGAASERWPPYLMLSPPRGDDEEEQEHEQEDSNVHRR